MDSRQKLWDAMNRVNAGYVLDFQSFLKAPAVHLSMFAAFCWLKQTPENDDTKLIRKALESINDTGALPDDLTACSSDP